MKLAGKLAKIRNLFVDELWTIQGFIEATGKWLSAQEADLVPSVLDSQDDTGLKEEAITLIQLLEKYRDTGYKDAKPIDLSPKASRVMIGLLALKRNKAMLAEMTLSYLVAHQEAFFKDYLFEVLISDKLFLKSKKELTYEEICGFQSFQSLLAHMAGKEVKRFSEGSIDDVADYFDKKFNIRLQEFSHWSVLAEATQRRHIIIHNRGVTDETYCFKTGFDKAGERLHTDLDYLRDVCAALIEFIGFLHQQLTAKLKIDPDATGVFPIRY